MIIVPSKPLENNDPNVLPIRVVLQNRADLLAVFLRFFRLLFQSGACGDGLLWRDSDKTGIWIYDASPENPGKVPENPVPGIKLEIGGARYYQNFESADGASAGGVGTKDRTYYRAVGISVEVRGRNKAETYKITDTAADLLMIMKPFLLGEVQNLDTMESPTLAPVLALNQAGPSGDSPLIFQSGFSFNVTYFVSFNILEKGQNGAIEDANAGGMSFGGQQTREHPKAYSEGKRQGLFTYADFVTEAYDKNDPTNTVVVSNQLILPDRYDPPK